MKFCHSSIYRFAGSDSVGVISIRDRICSLAYACQPPAVLPGEGEAVTVGEGVASFIADVGLLYESVQEESNPNVILLTLGLLCITFFKRQ